MRCDRVVELSNGRTVFLCPRFGDPLCFRLRGASFPLKNLQLQLHLRKLLPKMQILLQRKSLSWSEQFAVADSQSLRQLTQGSAFFAEVCFGFRLCIFEIGEAEHFLLALRVDDFQ